MLTTATVKSSLTLNEVVLPIDTEEQQELITSLEDGIRAVVSANLSSGNRVKEVNILTINGQSLTDLEASESEGGMYLFGDGQDFDRRLDSPSSKTGERALQSSMDVTFDVVIENVCKETCTVLGESCKCAGVTEGLGDDVLEEVEASLTDGDTVSSVLSEKDVTSFMLQYVTVGDAFVDPAVEVEEVTSVQDVIQRGPSLPPTYAPSTVWPTEAPTSSPSGSSQPSSVSSPVPSESRRPSSAPTVEPTSSRAPQVYVAEMIRTVIVRISSTLVLGGLGVPTNLDEREELENSFRDALASVVSGSLDEKYDIDDVVILSLGGEPAPMRVRTRIPQIIGRLLRALQASTPVEFQLVVHHACGDSCGNTDIETSIARSDVVQVVAMNFNNYPTLQTTLRGSDNDALQGVTVEAFAIDTVEATTEDLEVQGPTISPTSAPSTESPTASPVTTLAPTSSTGPSIAPTLSSLPSFLPTPHTKSPTASPVVTFAPSSSAGPSIVPTFSSSPSFLPSYDPSLAPSYAPTTASPTSFVCEDDVDFQFEDGDRVKTCLTYLNTGRPAVLTSRCQRELDNGKQVRDYCKVRCGVCEPVVVEEAEDEESAAANVDEILTTVKMPASITVSGIDVPTDSGARLDFAGLVEERIASTLSEALYEGYDLEDVKLLYIDDEPVVIAAVTRRRSRDHVYTGLLRGRALQVSAALKFEFTISHICAFDCTDSIADVVRSNVLQMVNTRMFNYAEVQTALRESGSEVLKDAVVKAFTIGSGIEVTSEVLAPTNETDTDNDVGGGDSEVFDDDILSQLDDFVEPVIDTTSNVTELETDSSTNGTSIPTEAPSSVASLPLAPEVELVDFGSDPAAEDLPLSRCQGDCDDDR